jgi:hypothetical protein
MNASCGDACYRGSAEAGVRTRSLGQIARPRAERERVRRVSVGPSARGPGSSATRAHRLSRAWLNRKPLPDDLQTGYVCRRGLGLTA